MIEAEITIKKELLFWDRLKLHWMRTVLYQCWFYGWRLGLFFYVIVSVNNNFEAQHLSKYHALAFLSFWLLLCVFDFYRWCRELKRLAKDFTFSAALSEEGVLIDGKDTVIPWSNYTNYKEFSDYIRITHNTGEFSYLPKQDNLKELIDFTKSKIER